MSTLELLEDMSTWTINEYDMAGAHINEHILSDVEIDKKLQDLMLECLANNIEKRFSSFLEKEQAVELIHEALKNHLIQKRIIKWMESPFYKEQKRLVIGFPANDIIGCLYSTDGKNILYHECKHICLVFLKTADSFMLYTVYPEKEHIKLIAL